MHLTLNFKGVLSNDTRKLINNGNIWMLWLTHSWIKYKNELNIERSCTHREEEGGSWIKLLPTSVSMNFRSNDDSFWNVSNFTHLFGFFYFLQEKTTNFIAFLPFSLLSMRTALIHIVTLLITKLNTNNWLTN